MFRLNEELQIINCPSNRPIFIIDDFYENPKEVEDYLFNRNSPLWKINDAGSKNGVYFEDRRFSIYDERLREAYDYLSELCGQKYFSCDVNTNMTRFTKDSFNDYENCIWWPHKDTGYNGIVYFSDECGTCLYEDLGVDGDTVEHREPWRPKDNYKVLEKLVAKYNRMVLFDGMIPHAMDICSDRYFGEEYRKNQVFFFNKDESNF